MADKWLVIDAHNHYLPPEAVARTGKAGSFDFTTLLKGEMSSVYQKFQDMEALLRIMEDSGIDMALLNYASWNEQGLEICRVMNDSYYRIGRQYPGKFILCGHIPLEAGPGVIEEAERCINILGFKAISLPSSMPETTLDSPELWPVYEKVSLLDVPVVIHPTLRFPIWGGGKKYNMSRTISREYEIAKGLVEVLYGVLTDFPNLKFLMPHYGGGMTGLKARLRSWYQPEGWVVPREIKNCPKTPREMDELGLSEAFDNLFDRLYFDMAGAGAGWLPMIKSAILMIRTDRLCFGTDYLPGYTHLRRHEDLYR